jgi:hypothetical protein
VIAHPIWGIDEKIAYRGCRWINFSSLRHAGMVSKNLEHLYWPARINHNGTDAHLVDGKPHVLNERYYPGHIGTDYKISHCVVMFVTEKGVITDVYATGNMPWCSDKYAAERKRK